MKNVYRPLIDLSLRIKKKSVGSVRTDVRRTGNSRSQHAHVHRRRDGRVKKLHTAKQGRCLVIALRNPPPPSRQEVAPCIFTAGAARYGREGGGNFF